jgi:hypothetical protein
VNIKNRKVVDVAGSKDRENTNVGVYRSHGGKNQMWDVVYVDEYDDWKSKQKVDYGFKDGKIFNIVSRLRSRRLLTLGFDQNSFSIASKNNSPFQAFIFDAKTGSILPFLNQSKAVTIGKSGRDRKLLLEPNTKDWFKNWRYDSDGHITNEKGKCFDVDARRDREGQKVISWRRYNHNN